MATCALRILAHSTQKTSQPSHDRLCNVTISPQAAVLCCTFARATTNASRFCTPPSRPLVPTSHAHKLYLLYCWCNCDECVLCTSTRLSMCACLLEKTLRRSMMPAARRPAAGRPAARCWRSASNVTREMYGTRSTVRAPPSFMAATVPDARCCCHSSADRHTPHYTAAHDYALSAPIASTTVTATSSGRPVADYCDDSASARA